MPRSFHNIANDWVDRSRSGLGQRATSFVLALFVQGLFILVLLTLGNNIIMKEEPVPTTFAMSDVAPPSPVADDQPAPPEPAVNDVQPVKQPETPPPEPEIRPPEPLKPPSALSPPAIIKVPRNDVATADVIGPKSPPVPAPPVKKRVYGPPDTGTPGDTPRVAGTGPQGQPLYAASWYREPYDDELRGYLSTAQGPGWALIACRTVPDYRVEDCQKVDEFPAGSGMSAAVLAAAWQFRVRPPRIGGRSQIGEWVRIRIDYRIGRN